MAEIHLWPEETFEEGGFIQVGFTLEKANHERIPVWYRLPSEYLHWITKGCEPFVLASLFTSMRTHANLRVHGEVAPTLLANLEEFQAAWSMWYPNHYHRIEILADTEREQPMPRTTAAIATFSGGVDSCFTVWRHTRGAATRRKLELTAGLIIHGMDIPLGRKDTFGRAKEKAKILLDSLEIDLIPMTSNRKVLGGNIAHSHGAILASCLTLFQREYRTGLIAGAQSYADLYFPWGSNPITDKFLSSGGFKIIYDSTDVARNRKVREIANWPEVHQYLRVCLGENRNQRDKNCCHCEKCIRTILNFRALGLGLPACFEQDVSLGRILIMGFQKEVKFPQYYEAILTDARDFNISGIWIWAVRLMIFITRLRLLVTKSIPIRRLHRHTQQRKRNSR